MINEQHQTPIRILIVDDSSSVREILKGIFEQTEDMTVIGEAVNGIEAIDMAMTLKPDLITMDISMPKMGGHEAIEHIMASQAVPILVISSMDDAETSLKAISNGALDLFPKSDISSDEFIEKVRLVSKIKVITHLRSSRYAERKTIEAPAKKIAVPEFPQEFNNPDQDRIIAIASSTGGPQTLVFLLSTITDKFPYPIVIAQHIAQGFTDGLVDVLGHSSLLKVKKGEYGERIEPGIVYVSPSSKHMFIDRNRKVDFFERQKSDIYFPSCNRLLSSVAEVYGRGSIGIILTGMGKDGVAGIRMIKEVGGKTIAQDEPTSIVFGMPKEAIDLGCIDRVASIQEIGAELLAMCDH